MKHLRQEIDWTEYSISRLHCIEIKIAQDNFEEGKYRMEDISIAVQLIAENKHAELSKCEIGNHVYYYRG